MRRRLDTIYNLGETTEVDMADFAPRIRQHRERQERLDTGEDSCPPPCTSCMSYSLALERAKATSMCPVFSLCGRPVARA